MHSNRKKDRIVGHYFVSLTNGMVLYALKVVEPCSLCTDKYCGRKIVRTLTIQSGVGRDLRLGMISPTFPHLDERDLFAVSESWCVLNKLMFKKMTPKEYRAYVEINP